MKKIKCSYCGKYFNCPNWRIDKFNELFCSVDCKKNKAKTNVYVKEKNYYKIILKNNNAEILIDLEDYTKVKKYHWYLKAGYVASEIKNKNGRKTIKLHRLIMDCPDGKVIDHINHNTLDNRKSNLRVVTQVENMQNTYLRKDNKTGYIGVYKNCKYNSYTANIKINNKCIYLGSFKTLNEAINARKSAEKKYWKYKTEIIQKCEEVNK